MKSLFFNSRRAILLIASLAMSIAWSSVMADNSPLCFTARNGSVDVKFHIVNVTHTIQYSRDNVQWQTYKSDTVYRIAADSSIYFRAETNQTTATPFSTMNIDAKSSRFRFLSTDGGTVEASGNIMSLYGPDCPNLKLPPYGLSRIFSNCSLLTVAPELPAMDLDTACYFEMFANCSSLIAVPELPAETLADFCYLQMFADCTSLTEVPDTLHAMSLGVSCYLAMFYGCTSLKTIPYLPATELKDYCYNSMFVGCTSLRVNTTGPGREWKIPATSSAIESVDSMFYLTKGTMNVTPALNTVYYIDDTPTAVDEVEENVELAIVPNPVRLGEPINISVEDGSTVEVYNMNGQCLWQHNAATTTISVESPNEAGVYLIKTTAPTGIINTGLLIVE